MNKLAELHLEAFTYTEYSPEDKVPNFIGFAEASAEITQEIAVEFGNFLFSKGIEYYDDLANGVNYTVENKEGTFTMKDLFQEFLKTKQIII